MYRELLEEVGLLPQHVKILGRTRDWMRYEVPTNWVRRERRGSYKGQKQIWFLLKLVGRECDVCLRASSHPEFDGWRWNEYWAPVDAVIEFKRDVYERALAELARFLRGVESREAYLTRIGRPSGAALRCWRARRRRSLDAIRRAWPAVFRRGRLPRRLA